LSHRNNFGGWVFIVQQVVSLEQRGRVLPEMRVKITVAETEIDIEAPPCRRWPTRKNRIEYGARLRVGQVFAVIKAFQLRGSGICSREKICKSGGPDRFIVYFCYFTMFLLLAFPIIIIMRFF
jgi:hypothetical protein